jgi:PAS domain S-box-containing protein
MGSPWKSGKSPEISLLLPFSKLTIYMPEKTFSLYLIQRNNFVKNGSDEKKLHVLIIEDSQADAELNVSLLQSEGYEITWQRVETAGEMINAIDRVPWDLVLSDYSMPEFNVDEALKIHMNHGRDIPFIVVSGTIGEEKVVQLIKAGVHNYIQKNSMARFIPVVERELSEANIRRELILTHAALVASEEKYRSYIEHDPDGVFVADETGKYIEVNEAACRITGYSKEELLTMSVLDLLPERSVNDGLAHFRKVLETGSAKADLVFMQKNGTKRWWSMEAVKLSKTRFLGFANDITSRIEMADSLKDYQFELVMQNQELSLAKSEIQVSSDRYTELFNFAPSGLFLLSADHIITEVNLSGASLLGRYSSDLTGCQFDHFISQDTLPYFTVFLTNVFKSKTKQICEVVLSAGSGQKTFVHVEGIVVSDSKQCLINVIDIT